MKPLRWFERIKLERVRKGLSQEEVSKLLDTSISWVKYVESSGANPKIHKMIAYAELLDLNIHDLIVEDQKLHERLDK